MAGLLACSPAWFPRHLKDARDSRAADLRTYIYRELTSPLSEHAKRPWPQLRLSCRIHLAFTMALPPKWYQFLVSVFASLGSLLFGYDLGVIASAIASPNFKSKFGDDPDEVGAVVSIFTGGAFFGAMFAGPTGDRLGRKITILIGALIFCLGGALQTAASHINFLYAGRCLAGVG
jgi:hypothetical protein